MRVLPTLENATKMNPRCLKNHHKYHLGDKALGRDIQTSHSLCAANPIIALSMNEGERAFVRRSDRSWRFAIVAEVNHQASPPYIVFVVKTDGSTKRVDMPHWADRIRPLKAKTIARAVSFGR